jgi:hypothetical protein
VRPPALCEIAQNRKTIVDKGVTGRRAMRQRGANLLGSIFEDVARI